MQTNKLMDVFVEVFGVQDDRATGPIRTGVWQGGGGEGSNPRDLSVSPMLLTSPELGLGRGRGWTGLEGEAGVRLPSSGTLLYLGGRPG